ncbi:hypothetical protein V0288_12985 [Pannus brasiliensis CCIBt3594]|uniref:Maturase K n=1 Tax=Pannus brasiliensis CCIBt3594 TaxID=1427578 RepID=A0AAW9QMA1_9CHRO
MVYLEFIISIVTEISRDRPGENLTERYGFRALSIYLGYRRIIERLSFRRD